MCVFVDLWDDSCHGRVAKLRSFDAVCMSSLLWIFTWVSICIHKNIHAKIVAILWEPFMVRGRKICEQRRNTCTYACVRTWETIYAHSPARIELESCTGTLEVEVHANDAVTSKPHARIILNARLRHWIAQAAKQRLMVFMHTCMHACSYNRLCPRGSIDAAEQHHHLSMEPAKFMTDADI